MPTLVTPELRIYHIESVAQLNEFAKASKIDWQLRGNIAQLLGFASVGSDRTCRHQASNYFVLHKATWMYHRDVEVAIPLFGSLPTKFASLKALSTTAVHMSLATFKRLVSTPGKVSDDGWWSDQPPEVLQLLSNGSSIANLLARAVSSCMGSGNAQDMMMQPPLTDGRQPSAESFSRLSAIQEVSEGAFPACDLRCTRCTHLSRSKTRSWRESGVNQTIIHVVRAHLHGSFSFTA